MQQNEILLLEAMPLVQSIAKSISCKIPIWIDKLDLVQEGYLAVLKSIPRYNSKIGSFINFIRPRIKGAMWDWIHKQYSHTESLDSMYDDNEYEIPVKSIVLEKICKEELENFIPIALDKLNFREQSIIKQYYYSDFTQETVAKLNGISQTRITQILHGVHYRLKINFNKHGFNAVVNS